MQDVTLHSVIWESEDSGSFAILPPIPLAEPEETEPHVCETQSTAEGMSMRVTSIDHPLLTEMSLMFCFSP